MNKNKKLKYYKIIIKVLLAEVILLAVYILGSSLNFLVVTANSCKMPVKFTDFSFETDKHFSFFDNSEVNYWFLSDIFNFHFFILSFGDLLIFISIFGLIFISIYIFKIKKTKNL